ncbi:MAG: biopolymer transporter ExbD [Cyanobacteriota bacterium]
MRFKQRSYGTPPPINLTPMLNVMMGILAFFVMITMLLSEERGVSVILPPGDNTPPPTEPEEPPEPLLVTLTAQRQLLIEGEPVPGNQWQGPVQVYLRSNPKGFVILQADRRLPYAQVVQTLAEMKQVGGDRVSLSIDPPSP